MPDLSTATTQNPTEHSLPAHGIALNAWHWVGSGPPVLFAHASGFHGRLWDAVIAALPGRDCWAVDLRGHGLSAKPAPPYDWRDLGHDLAAVIAHLNLHDVIGVGHSLGGHAITFAATLAPARFARLVLLDPTIMPKAVYGMGDAPPHFSARRRNEWTGPDDMEARFRERPPFNRWQPRVLHDYCEYGLLPNPDGPDMVLACPPLIEAGLYQTGNRANIYADLSRATMPIQVVRAATPMIPGKWDMLASPTEPTLAQHFPDATDLVLPDHSHFIPMEDPALVARLIAAG